MTNQVTSLTRLVSKEIIKKLFFKFQAVYGNLWSSRAKTDAEWEMCAITWHEGLQHFDLYTLKQAAAQVFLDYQDFPPTLGQLVAVCIKKSGVPSEEDVINFMIRREFNHPIVKLVYDKIGSWTLTNGKSDEIKSRTRAVYTECLMNFRENSKDLWEQLEASNSNKALPEPEKIPTQQERKSFKDRLAEYQRMAEDAKTKLKDQKHPDFDQKLVDRNSVYFDSKAHEEYKNYLLAIPERLVLSLPVPYAYDRMRFIAAREQPEFLRRAGFNPNVQGEEKVQPRGSQGHSKQYKNWTGD